MYQNDEELSDIVNFAVNNLQKKQELLQFKGHFKRDHPNSAIEPLKELLVRWIITDQQAFSVVESADLLQHWINGFNFQQDKPFLKAF